MADPQKAAATQLKNIEQKTGQSLEQLVRLVKRSGLTKHGEIRSMLIEKLGLGFGDANAIAKVALAPASAGSDTGANGDALAAIYAGNKAALRSLHTTLLQKLEKLGAFEIAPKKQYVSLRRAKQFATVGPGTSTRLDIGLIFRDGAPAKAARLKPLPSGGMCTHRASITAATEIDRELLAWIREAYEAAG